MSAGRSVSSCWVVPVTGPRQPSAPWKGELAYGTMTLARYHQSPSMLVFQLPRASRAPLSMEAAVSVTTGMSAFTGAAPSTPSVRESSAVWFAYVSSALQAAKLS